MQGLHKSDTEQEPQRNLSRQETHLGESNSLQVTYRLFFKVWDSLNVKNFKIKTI